MGGMPNPMMMGGTNQFMTGMGGMGGPMGGPGGFGPGGMFATNMNPMMGGGFSGMAGMGGNFGTNINPPMGGGGFGGPSNSSNLGQTTLASGPGPSIESFKKDGFNILGKQAFIKKEEEEGSKEFAELFSLADTKIKDRSQPIQKPSYEYNPIVIN